MFFLFQLLSQLEMLFSFFFMVVFEVPECIRDDDVGVNSEAQKQVRWHVSSSVCECVC